MKSRTEDHLEERSSIGRGVVRARPGGTGYLPSLLILACTVLLSLVAPLGLVGQEFSQPLLPVGRLRFEVNSLFHFADERFGRRTESGTLVKETEPLGFDFVDAAVGSRLFPALENLEADLATATGATIAPLVLGKTRAVLTKDAVWLPLRLDLGVLDWLTVGGMVPFSRRRAEFETSFQDTGANVGLTPDGNTFLAAVGAANLALDGVVTSLCGADPSSPACTQATTLLADGEGLHGALSNGYSNHAVFPLTGSETGDALQARVTTLETAYQAVGVATFPSSVPLATTVLTNDSYKNLVTSTGLDIQGDSLSTWRSPWEMGDAEMYARARLWRSSDEIGANGAAPSFRMEIGAGVLFRLGSGRIDSPRNFLDTGSGDGQNDIEVSVFGALDSGERLSVVGEFRYGVQRPVQVRKRVTAPDRIFAPLTPAEQTVRWNPGDYAQFRLSPRVHLTQEVTLVFDLRYFRKKSDRYRLDEAVAGVDPTLLELETKQRRLGMGGGVVYSTVRSGRGRPVEARFLFHKAISGGGGATPKTSRFEVGLRFYRGIW